MIGSARSIAEASLSRAEARMNRRRTPHGMRVTYDDGQNVCVDELGPCPWCGPQTREDLRPYVQVRGRSWPLPHLRVICPVCKASTAFTTYEGADTDAAALDEAVEDVIARWNARCGSDSAAGGEVRI